MKPGRTLFSCAAHQEAKAAIACDDGRPAEAKPRPRIVAYAIVTQFNTLRIWWQLKPAELPEMAFGERFVELVEFEADQ